MNDRYLFRGKICALHGLDYEEWCKDPWRTGFLLKYNKTVNIGYFSESFEVDPNTIGQCTGKPAEKSYRGNQPEDLLIFEGDIVSGYDTTGHSRPSTKTVAGVVFWASDMLAWYVNVSDCHAVALCHIDKVRIVGIVHDIPKSL